MGVCSVAHRTESPGILILNDAGKELSSGSALTLVEGFKSRRGSILRCGAVVNRSSGRLRLHGAETPRRALKSWQFAARAEAGGRVREVGFVGLGKAPECVAY